MNYASSVFCCIAGREEIRLQYRQACRQTNSLIVESRQKYHRDQLNDASKKPRRKWSIIRNILHQNSLSDARPISECRELANKLSRFFRDKIRLVKDRINLSLSNLNLDPLFADSIYLGTC